MSHIQLTQGQFALVDDEDFEFLSSFNWFAMWKSNPKAFYAARNSGRGSNGKQRVIYMHRIIVSAIAGEVVDHINHMSLDNRKANLRKCSNQENVRSQKLHHGNTSGFKGVSLHHRTMKWRAYINVGGKQSHLGLHQNPEDAARAYDAEAVNRFGEFALTNEKLGLLAPSRGSL